MITEKEYPELYQAIKKSREMRRNWLIDSLKAGILCELLPEEIKKLTITEIDLEAGGLKLGVKAEEGTVNTLKVLGIQGLKPQVSSRSKKIFYTVGQGVLRDGSPLKILISNIEEPEGCQVVETTRTSKEYVLVCEKTGEKI